MIQLPSQTTPNSETYLSAVIVPRTTSSRDIAALETAMHGLALDADRPVALELAATTTSRMFLLRATTCMALRHLEDQIRSRYPQAIIQPVAAQEDPLRLQADETVSACELRPGAAAYLPLRSWKAHDLEQVGADPLLGILGACNHLPDHLRVVAQLVLIPVAPTWSRAYRRKAVEHPLEQERLQTRREMSSGAGGGSNPSTAKLVSLGVLVALLLLWLRFKRWLAPLIPAWLLQAAAAILHGKQPEVTATHMTALVIGGFVLLGVCFVLAFMIMQFQSRRGTGSLYDMRLVDQKTARLAYRVRLRLFVLAPDEGRGCESIFPSSTWLPTRIYLTVRRFLSRVPPLNQWRWQFVKVMYRQSRQEAARRRRQRQPRQDALAQFVAAYRQYATAAGGYFLARPIRQRKARRLLVHRSGWLHTPRSGWAYDVKRSQHLLSVADVAALWHLPQAHDLLDLPYVERSRARSVLVPAMLTTGNGWRIGESQHAGQVAPVYLPHACLRHNFLAIAKTGKGKSTLFQHLAQAVFAARATVSAPTASTPHAMSLACIEPHGDTVQALLGLIPPAERDNVALVDLANTRSPVGINPLDMTGKDRDKVVDTLITIAEHLWASSYGSRTENVLEYALKTLADVNETLVKCDPQHGPDQQYTLLDVVALLALDGFRHSLMEKVTDNLLIDWWQRYYEPLDARLQHEITSSVITKISKFASSRTARRILGQPRSTIDLGAIIREGKMLLVSTANGVVGADVGELVGITLLGLLQTALAEQARLQPEARRRYLVLIDEFQVFRGADYQTMLAEMRKYGGSFGLATQSLAYLDKLDRTLRATVFANIDHLFAFTMAGEDARLLHELDGIEPDDLTNLDDFQCYVKLSVGGHRLPIFSLQLDAPPTPDAELAATMRLRSQQRDTQPAGAVDEMLKQMLARQKEAAKKKKAAPATAGQSKPSANHAAPTPSPGDGGKGTAPAHHKGKRGIGSKPNAPAATEDTMLTVQMHTMYGEVSETTEDEANPPASGTSHDGEP
jgi:hypothetical protein